MATELQPELEPETTQVDAAEASAHEPKLSEVELIASELGWKADFDGDPAKRKTAADFIRAERDISKGLKDTVRGLKDTVERMAATENRRTERALREQAAEIGARFDQAVEDGDRKGAAAAAREMRELEHSAVDNSPEARFAADNPWYGKSDDATDYAVAISQREARKGATIEQQLKAASEGVRKRFPELFEESAPPTPPKPQPSVHAPASRSSQPRQGTAFGDLPAEVKAAARSHAKLVHAKFGKDQAQAEADYARDYFANIAA